MGINDGACSIKECERPAHIRGYCSMHYQRFMKHGDPLAGNGRYSTPEAAIAARSKREGACLVWTGHANAKGYPRMNVGGNKLVLVYRYVWERANGPIPDGAEIDHICFNRACLELSHLRLSDRVANTRHRMGAQPNSISGVRNVHRRGNRWVVRLKSKGKHFEFGSFDTIEAAAVAAKAARREMFGVD